MSNAISHFYGMTILMSSDPTDTTPHFEVVYKDQLSKFSIPTGRMYAGNLIPDGQEIIKAWHSIYKHRLEENWNLLNNKSLPKLIPPIE